MLLDEVRSLLSDAEDWVREEPVPSRDAADAVERSETALAAGEVRSKIALAIP